MTEIRSQKSEVSTSLAFTALLLALCFFGALLFALSYPAEAQPAKIYRIGYLDNASFSGSARLLEGLRQRLRELGWVEGKNISYEYRFAEGKLERLPKLAAELMQMKVDMLVTRSTSVAVAAKQVTSTMPIVMISVGDPVGAGLIESLARPGGNVTGLTNFAPELIAKRLELLKEVVPRATRVGVLTPEGQTPGVQRQRKDLEAAAASLNVKLQYLESKREAKGLEHAFEAGMRGRVDGIILIASPFFSSERRRIVELAAAHRMPVIHTSKEYVEAGGLLSYGVSQDDSPRRAAIYVDKILKGAKPAELPVEQPTKFEFVVNLKAAKQIGLTIPPNVLARADKVIR
jgi:putative ABC transport system substrate-binding protein